MKRMLINATQEEELRMAMVDGQRLYDLNIEGPASERKKANIYKGKITRIEPSLEAAFVDYGAERHGFLPLKEISSEYFVKQPESGSKPNIKDVLNEGQDIVVQIDKEERGNKGAALTTFVSLAGRFIVLKPNKSRSGGVSRRIVGADRDDARRSLNEIEVPKDMSVILRTAGIDRTAEELAWDLENLLDIWQKILNVVLQQPSPFLIYRESNAVSRALRDYLTNDIGEILIDDEATYKLAVEQVESFMPHNLRKLKHYTDPVPLFTRFQIESQIESAFAHKVNLPSGGSIVIDHTEALVSIDINSARATKGGDIEATALNTNLEAADEIARQLRIRDLGGLIVIDFIDMGPQKNQREVENRLREAVRQDRARVQIGKITRFGLLEMSRQRLRPSIGESAYQTCPRCSGFGTIRSIESLALAILRIIGEEARKERTAKVIAQLPVEVATYLLNEKRDWVQTLETSHDTQVVLVANSHLETPHYDIRRVRDDQTELPENAGVSYALVDADTTADVPTSIEERKVAEQAAIGVIKPTTPAPVRKEPESGGFWAWLVGLFSGDETKKKTKKKKKASRRKSSQDRGRRGRGSRDRDRQRDDQRKPGGRQQRGKKKAAQGKQPGKKKTRGGQPQKAKGGQPQGQKQAAQADEARDDGKRPTRSRRSRGGRRRRRGGDRPAGQDQQAQDQAQQKPPGKAKPASKPASEAKRDTGQKPDAKAEKPAAADKERQSEQPVRAKKEPQSGKPAEAMKEARPEKPAEAKKETKAEKPAEAMKEARPEKPAETKPEKPAAAKKETKAEKVADAKQAEKPAAAQDGNGGASKAKPEGRLLPWEPQAPVEAETKPKSGSAKPGSEAPKASSDSPKPAPAESTPRQSESAPEQQ